MGKPEWNIKALSREAFSKRRIREGPQRRRSSHDGWELSEHHWQPTVVSKSVRLPLMTPNCVLILWELLLLWLFYFRVCLTTLYIVSYGWNSKPRVFHPKSFSWGLRMPQSGVLTEQFPPTSAVRGETWGRFNWEHTETKSMKIQHFQIDLTDFFFKSLSIKISYQKFWRTKGFKFSG